MGVEIEIVCFLFGIMLWVLWFEGVMRVFCFEFVEEKNEVLVECMVRSLFWNVLELVMGVERMYIVVVRRRSVRKLEM